MTARFTISLRRPDDFKGFLGDPGPRPMPQEGILRWAERLDAVVATAAELWRVSAKTLTTPMSPANSRPT